MKILSDTKLERLSDDKLIQIRNKAKAIQTGEFNMNTDYKAIGLYIKTIANILYENSVRRALKE